MCVHYIHVIFLSLKWNQKIHKILNKYIIKINKGTAQKQQQQDFSFDSPGKVTPKPKLQEIIVKIRTDHHHHNNAMDCFLFDTNLSHHKHLLLLSKLSIGNKYF